jgi:hypothetical protein
VGFDLITVPSHTSDTLQPLDVTFFKPFKIAFKSYKDVWTLANKRKGVGKKDLASWMSLAFKKKNIESIKHLQRLHNHWDLAL